MTTPTQLPGQETPPTRVVQLNILPIEPPQPKVILNILPLEEAPKAPPQALPAANPNSRLLKERHPEIFAQIHPTKNEGIDLDKLTYGVRLKLWWMCPHSNCGHHIWYASVNNRTSHDSGCAFCRNLQTCKCDSFYTKYPQIAEEFAFDLNPGIDPFTISPGSHTKLWWRCSRSKCGHHVWNTTIHSRTANDNNCPFCHGLRTCECDSFYTKNPQLAAEFAPNLNLGINPLEISPGSHIKLWWKCLKSRCDHHIWHAMVNDRSYGHGCPYCQNKITCECDSFYVKYPDLAAEFSEQLNPGIDPCTISPGSNLKLWWLCSKKQDERHIWITSVNKRTDGRGCPYCKSSRLEASIHRCLKEQQITSIQQMRFEQCRNERPLPFDFYVPQHNALIEGDGIQHFEERAQFHQNIEGFALQQQKDQIKNTFCRENGIHLLRISYSELDNVATHIQTFIEAIKAAPHGQRVEMFMGEEYQHLALIQTAR